MKGRARRKANGERMHPVQEHEWAQLDALAGSEDRLPWSIKRTGGDLSILDANGRTVIKKVVSCLSIEGYQVLLKNFIFMVDAVNLWSDPAAEARATNFTNGEEGK